MGTASSVRSLTVLVLGWHEGDGDLTPWTESAARVDHVDTVEEALDALSRESYDLVISNAADFCSAHAVRFTRQAAAVIESICQGVGIVGKGGELDWAN